MSEKSKENPVGGEPVEATAVLPPMEYKPSEKEQAILDKITANEMVPLQEMDQVEIGCLGKLKRYNLVEIKGRPKRERYACLYGWVKPPDPEPEEEADPVVE